MYRTIDDDWREIDTDAVISVLNNWKKSIKVNGPIGYEYPVSWSPRKNLIFQGILNRSKLFWWFFRSIPRSPKFNLQQEMINSIEKLLVLCQQRKKQADWEVFHYNPFYLKMCRSIDFHIYYTMTEDEVREVVKAHYRFKKNEFQIRGTFLNGKKEYLWV